MLSDRVFFWTALLLHVAVLSFAMAIEKIDNVVLFTGTIGGASVTFLFPGLAYIVALRHFGDTPRHRGNWSTIFYHMMAWAFVASFVVIVSTFIYLSFCDESPVELEAIGTDPTPQIDVKEKSD